MVAHRTAPAVHAAGLSFTYSTRLKAALAGVSFDVASGETVLVLGPSGSGKSTLTLCLDGLIPHLIEGDYAGEVVVAGLVVKETPVAVSAHQTGLVFQDPETQFCTLTVDDEIAFGLENLGAPPEDMEDAIARSLDIVGLPHLRGRSLASLSGGEKQRVALAAVLAMGPRLLVLDEPSANLDPGATEELFRILRGLAAGRRHTILVIEHKLDEVIEWVDSVLVLDGDGRPLFRGDPVSAFYARRAELAAAGVWRPQTVELVTGLREAGWRVPGGPLSVSDTVNALRVTPGLVECLGRPAHERPIPHQAEEAREGHPLLEASRLNYAYGDGRRVLTDVSLAVHTGEFLAIVGANGAGKTTLGSLLSGVLRPSRGTVFVKGQDAVDLPAWSWAATVGYVFQNPEHQFVAATAREELAYSLSAGRRGRKDQSTPEQRRLVDEWLERLGLRHLAEANPFSLSQGQKRRLSVAAMLMRGCPLLILDEPTLGQDALQSSGLMDLMHEFKEAGGTVVMITHDMRIVAEHASRVVVLGAGTVLYSGTPGGLFAQPDLVHEARLSLPALAPVGSRLLSANAAEAGLLTARGFLQAAGKAPEPTGEPAGITVSVAAEEG